MKQMFVGCLAIVCLAAQAPGASIVVRRMRYDRRTIVGLSEGSLISRTPRHKASIRKKLADITRIYLTVEMTFNEADALRAAKK